MIIAFDVGLIPRNKQFITPKNDEAADWTIDWSMQHLSHTLKYISYSEISLIPYSIRKLYYLGCYFLTLPVISVDKNIYISSHAERMTSLTLSKYHWKPAVDQATEGPGSYIWVSFEYMLKCQTSLRCLLWTLDCVFFNIDCQSKWVK